MTSLLQRSSKLQSARDDKGGSMTMVVVTAHAGGSETKANQISVAHRLNRLRVSDSGFLAELPRGNYWVPSSKATREMAIAVTTEPATTAFIGGTAASALIILASTEITRSATGM